MKTIKRFCGNSDFAAQTKHLVYDVLIIKTRNKAVHERTSASKAQTNLTKKEVFCGFLRKHQEASFVRSKKQASSISSQIWPLPYVCHYEYLKAYFRCDMPNLNPNHVRESEFAKKSCNERGTMRHCVKCCGIFQNNPKKTPSALRGAIRNNEKEATTETRSDTDTS